MDLEFDARYDAFREEVRRFLEKHRPAESMGMNSASKTKRAAWLTLQIEHGYWARTIPKERSAARRAELPGRPGRGSRRSSRRS
jgi:alkylation response protein AidB-like acyl-CoA dehydrogenase